MKSIGHFINGAPVAGTSGRTGPVFNPATGEQTAEVALANAAEVDAAVAAARAALPGWSAMPPLRRARIMFRFNELILQHADELAAMITAEHGKTVEDSHGDLTRGREVVEFACGIPHLMRGDFTEDVGTGVDAFSIRQPVGVCAGITPFNFPAMIPLWMAPLAIACGNTFILKPSERDPSCPMKLVELGKEAGLPDGVLNMVNGDKECVDAILHHPGIDAVSFVGSTPVAAYIYATAALDRQARTGARRCQEPSRRHARRQTWTRSTDALISARPTARPASAAWRCQRRRPGRPRNGLIALVSHSQATRVESAQGCVPIPMPTL